MRILFFGRLQDAAGRQEMTVDLPADVRDAGAVRRWLGGDLPDLCDSRVRMAVNDQLVSNAACVEDGDEVAFLPPVSGG